MQYLSHLFVPGIVPPNSPPGLYDVAETSPLFLYARSLCDTGGTWLQYRHPVADFDLVKVQAVVPGAGILAMFNGWQLAMTGRRTKGGSLFNYNSQAFSQEQLNVLNVLRASFREKEPGAGNRSVNTIHCFHGTRRENVENICENGPVAVGETDDGFFGWGFYSSLNIEYAARYAYGDFDTDADGNETGPRASPDGLYPVIMLAATIGVAYPVTREKDYVAGNDDSRLLGQHLKSEFNAHVACVSDAAGYQAVSRDECEYVELVIEQQAQLLPIAVLWFRRRP